MAVGNTPLNYLNFVITNKDNNYVGTESKVENIKLSKTHNTKRETVGLNNSVKSQSLLKDAMMVFLEVTNHCNFHCHFCPQVISARPHEHMDTELAKILIEQLHEAGYENNLYFHLLGEPLLHPDIFKIVEFASKRIPRAILFTNGSLLTENNIESIFDARPYELVISMQLVDEQSFKLRCSSMSWDQYVSRIRNTIQYKLTHNTPTLLRISVGIRKEDSAYPYDNYFPRISPSSLRANMIKLFSNIPSLSPQQVQKLLSLVEVPFEGQLELDSDVSVSIKPMGNWRRIYRNEKVEKGYCPHVGKEFGILSNGDIVFCHLDYDGKTRFANAKDGELRHTLENPKIQKEIVQFLTKGIVPTGCQHCIMPYKYSKQAVCK